MSKVKLSDEEMNRRLRQFAEQQVIAIQQLKRTLEVKELFLSNALEDSCRWQQKYREARRGWVGRLILRVRVWRWGRKGKSDGQSKA